MADPVSVTASLLAMTTAALDSAKSLYKTVKRYRERDKTLLRLQNELEDVTKILTSLTNVTDADESMVSLLHGPVERCSQRCREFESSMLKFKEKSKIGFLDWTRMEFMRGDINEFIDTIAGYKSTISIGLGTINMSTMQVSRDVLVEYNEMIKDTTYNLELHLQRIDEKINRLTVEHINNSSIRVDLKDERVVTEQCLRICEDAKSYLQNLSNQASNLLHGTPQSTNQECSYEAQLRTRQALDQNQENFMQTIDHISKRLESLLRNDNSDDKERLRLQSDIEISKQCLDVCRAASEMSRQKVYKIGEIIADGDSDQVVVTTLADLFDVGKALSKNNSAQLVGSMGEESLQHLTEHRYRSRFGALAISPRAEKSVTTYSHGDSEARKGDLVSTPHQAQHVDSWAAQSKPSSNETRKRTPGDAMDSRQLP